MAATGACSYGPCGPCVTGEQLRLRIASRTALLRSDVAQGYEHFDMMVPPYFSRNTIHFGETSYVEVEERAI